VIAHVNNAWDHFHISKSMFEVLFQMCNILFEHNGECHSMITAAQLRAARALLGIDQRDLADKANLSVPTIQRMESSDGVIRGNVDSLTKLVAALEDAGIELINDGAISPVGGRGVRLREHVGRPKAYRGTRQSAGSVA
jgi:DNA-binding XRE family transcriptional regulator